MSDQKVRLTFEQKMADLESIMDWFESGDVTLDKSMREFERGMKLAEELEKELQTAENKIQKIKLKFQGGA